MDYQPKLLRYGFSTLLGSLIVVALLVLPGRAGAATIVQTVTYPSVGPIIAAGTLGVSDSFSGLIGDTFLDHFMFSVQPSATFTLTTNSLFQSGLTVSSGELWNGAGTTQFFPTGSPFFTSSPILSPGAYDLRISGTLTATSGLHGVAINFSPTTPIPEPETYAMMLAGLGLMGFVARRRKPGRVLA